MTGYYDKMFYQGQQFTTHIQTDSKNDIHVRVMSDSYKTMMDFVTGVTRFY